MRRRCSYLVQVALPLALAFGLHVESAAAQSEATDPTANGLLADCQRSSLFGGPTFSCHGLVAGVSENEGLPPSRVLEIFTAGMRAVVGSIGELSTTVTTFAAEGKEWPGVFLSLHQPGETKNLIEGHLLVFESGEGAIRTAFCLSPPSQPVMIERCRRLLPMLADKGPAPFRITPAEPTFLPTFLGKPLALPAGCKTLDASDKGFRVQCGAAALLSMRLSNLEELPMGLGVTSEMLLHAFRATPGEDRDCYIGGVMAKCRTFHAGEGPNRIVFYVGGAEVEKVPVVVACGQPADQTAVDPLCANVMTFSAGAATGSGPRLP